MTNYQFIIEVPAETQVEAEAKLKLLLELGAFFKDFDAGRLTGTFLHYLLLIAVGKCGRKVNNTSNNKQN